MSDPMLWQQFQKPPSYHPTEGERVIIMDEHGDISVLTWGDTFCQCLATCGWQLWRRHPIQRYAKEEE